MVRGVQISKTLLVRPHMSTAPRGTIKESTFWSTQKSAKTSWGTEKTLIGLIKEDLKTVGETIANAIDIAQDKQKFQELVINVVSRQRETQQGDI